MKSRERGRTREERVHGEMSRLSNGRRYRLVAGRPQFAHRGVFDGRSVMPLSPSLPLSIYLSIYLSRARTMAIFARSITVERRRVVVVVVISVVTSLHRYRYKMRGRGPSYGIAHSNRAASASRRSTGGGYPLRGLGLIGITLGSFAAAISAN